MTAIPAEPGTPDTPDELVPLEVVRVAFRDGETEGVVVLRESHGASLLPIAVGFCEAAAIRQLVEEQKGGALPLRPLTHELLTRAIDKLGGRVERGVITKLENEVFFARLTLRAGERETTLDARPSDVICTCLVAGCTFYGTRQLLDQVTED